MSNFIILHLSKSDGKVNNHFASSGSDLNLGPKTLTAEQLDSQSFTVWETCRRLIIFSTHADIDLALFPKHTEVYHDVDAEEFLARVLCGLLSPLLGETEVFGQFKKWWSDLPADCEIKLQNCSRIQNLYNIVKKVRETALCGMGSQSYGSILRKHLTQISPKSPLEFIGAGQLVEEIIPWVQKKWSYTLRVRNPEKALYSSVGISAGRILPLENQLKLSPVVIVAAPLLSEELDQWLMDRGADENTTVFDFRSDSVEYKPTLALKNYFHLNHFTSEVLTHQKEIHHQVDFAESLLQSWAESNRSRSQIRPFGWDDL